MDAIRQSLPRAGPARPAAPSQMALRAQLGHHIMSPFRLQSWGFLRYTVAYFWTYPHGFESLWIIISFFGGTWMDMDGHWFMEWTSLWTSSLSGDMRCSPQLNVFVCWSYDILVCVSTEAHGWAWSSATPGWFAVHLWLILDLSQSAWFHPKRICFIMLHHASSCFIHNILSFLTIFHWWHLKIPGALFWVSLFSPFSLASPASRYLYCEYCNQSVFWWDPSCSWRHDMLCPRRTTTWELRWSETQQIKAIGRWVYILTMASVHQFLKLWAFRDPPILHQFLKLWAFRDPPIYTSLFQVNMIICTLW